MDAAEHPAADARLGEHIISICPDENRRLDLVASVFRGGLASGCLCLYLTGSLRPDAILSGLRRRGCDVNRAVACGQLVIRMAEETYLANGQFDPERMIGVWMETVARARRDGFEGMCATGEPTWLSSGVRGADRWLEYEAGLNLLDLQGVRASILCQYDGRSLPEWVYRELERLHPFVHRGDGVARSETYTGDPDELNAAPLVEDLEPPCDALPCHLVAELISADLDGQLSASRRAQLRRHLKTCEACTARAATYTALRKACRSLRAAPPVPSELWEKIRADLTRVSG